MTRTTLALILSSAVWQSAPAQTPAAPGNQLVGTWSLVLVDNVLPDGSRIHLYGPHPSGLLMFDAGGHYALQIVSAGRPPFAAGDKSRGTPDEYRTAVQGSNAHFGRYSADQAEHTITFRIEHATYPNWEGTEQKRSYSLVEDRLTYIVPAPTTGTGATGEVVWQRAR